MLAERMEFVEFWAEYCRTHPDADWGKQQAVLVNSGVQAGRALSVSAYKELRGL